MSKIDKTDEKNLKIIRDGVTSLIKESAKLYDCKNYLVLDIAPEIWNGAKEFFIHSEVHTLDIDMSSKATYIADITWTNETIIADNTYDVVVFTEVLEHTLNPFRAINEIYRILKPNGILIMTTPFNFRIHNPLPDCWRISEHWLRVLLNDFSSVIIKDNGSARFLFSVQYKTIAIK